MSYLVMLKDNELGKLNIDKTYRFSSLDEAKKFCERYYESLGDAQFYSDGEYVQFSREYCASDYLGIIQLP